MQRVYLELLRLAEPVAAVVTIGGKPAPPSWIIRDMPTHKDIASRVCFLDDGVILEEGPPAQIFSDPHQERTKQFLQRIIAAGRM